MSLANLHLHNVWVQGESYNPHAHEGSVCENCAAVQFSVEVGNGGDHDSGAFTTRFSLDGSEVHNEQVHSLGHGGTHWVQWRHNAMHAGSHTLTVLVDPAERIHESNEQDNSFSHTFDVLAAVPACREMTFAEGEADVVVGHGHPEAHGWKQIDVTFTMKDPLGAPLEGYEPFVVFYGPENEESSPTVGGAPFQHGMLRCPNQWLKPTGTLYLTAVPIAGGHFDGGPMLSGNAHYTLARGATTLFFDVQQGKEIITRTATSQQEVSEALKLEGHVGVKFEVIDVGGSVGHESGQTDTHGQQMQWNITVGTTTLTVTTAG